MFSIKVSTKCHKGNIDGWIYFLYDNHGRFYKENVENLSKKFSIKVSKNVIKGILLGGFITICWKVL
jgi:hypothetical protein